MTYTPFLSGLSLYATNTDKYITDHLIEKNYFETIKENDDLLRSVNKYIMHGTGLLTDNKIKRTLIGYSSIGLSSISTTMLNNNIHKKTPDGLNNWAIGSNHGSEPFAASLITYKNLEDTNINSYLKYGIVGINYSLSTAISLSRVEPSGHSFGDQLINASIGNFIAVFIHELFMVQPDMLFDVNFNEDSSYFAIKFKI
jgi:hypothetical protein